MSSTYDLVFAYTDERKAFESVLDIIYRCNYRDKGFIGASCPEAIANSTGNQIWTINCN